MINHVFKLVPEVLERALHRPCRRIAEAANGMAFDTARDIQNRVGPQLEEARRELDSLNHRVSGFIKERPIASLAIALAAGFVIGRIASR